MQPWFQLLRTTRPAADRVTLRIILRTPGDVLSLLWRRAAKNWIVTLDLYKVHNANIYSADQKKKGEITTTFVVAVFLHLQAFSSPEPNVLVPEPDQIDLYLSIVIGNKVQVFGFPVDIKSTSW